MWHFLLVEDDLGLRVGEGLGIGPDDVRHLQPLPDQTLTTRGQGAPGQPGQERPPRRRRPAMTHCVPNERVVVDR